MSYAIALPPTRYCLRWAGTYAGWPAVLAGLALFPQSLYMVLLSLPPLFTSSVLLLDAGPAVPNAVVGGCVTVAIAAVGWLLNRAITTADANVKELKEVVGSLTKLVNEIGTEQKASSQLTAYLKDRVDTLEKKKETLEKSFQEMDKIIDREIIHKKSQ